jgi:hypothetical protein
MAAASFTRDVTVVPLVALLFLTVQLRSRQAVALLVSGGLAVVPALALYGNSSVRNNLAFVFSGYNPPRDRSWSFILHSYPPHIRMLLHKDLLYGRVLCTARLRRRRGSGIRRAVRQLLGVPRGADIRPAGRRVASPAW